VFLLDSLMISGLKWVMKTVVTAAEAEMNDDTALREQLLDAEMRREMGEISEQEFGDLEADLLTRIREIKQRREGGSGPLSMSAQPIETSADSKFQIEASVSGDFHEPADAPHTTVVDSQPDSGEQVSVLDMEPGPADRRRSSRRGTGGTGRKRTTGTQRTERTTRTTRTTRTPGS
jgi:gas vesicle protein GvpG